VNQAELDALQETAERAKDCQKCRLSPTRTQVVWGTGNPANGVVFIGEAPGFNEDKKGIPFCGKAGGILDRLLLSGGLRRPDVYITNIVKCRPPENRDPEPDEISACSEYLDRQLALINPRIICCLGRHALAVMLKKYDLSAEGSITKLHGRVFTAGNNLFSTVNIVAFYHPAVATYNPGMFPVLQKDFAVLKTL